MKQAETSSDKTRLQAGRLFFLCCLLYGMDPFSLQAQPAAVSYARIVIDTLCSKLMNGRGYVQDGDRLASAYIAGELENAGVLPFAGNYYQEFPISVNTFPGKMKVRLNGVQLVPGRDFLVDPSCECRKGKYAVVRAVLDSNTVKEATKNQEPDPLETNARSLQQVSIAYQKESFRKSDLLRWQQLIGAGSSTGSGDRLILEFTSGKLTWSASQVSSPPCILRIRAPLPAGDRIKVEMDIEQELVPAYQTRNVAGYVKGLQTPDSFLVFTAHYDHLGQMGNETFFPGANDNASGVSMILNLARYFSENPARYSTAFLFFSGEEMGLLGSGYFTDHPLLPLDRIRFLLNLDIAGTGDEGIKVVNATEFPEAFQKLVHLNEEQQLLKQVAPRGKAANSDHYPFYQRGVPCFFLYTLGGIDAYHDIYDKPETLPLTDYEDLYQLIILFSRVL